MAKPDSQATRQAVRHDYRRLASAYETRWRHFNDAARDWVFSHWPEGLGDGAQVLDLGCGTGGFLAALEARRPGLRLVGLDLSPDMLDEARRAVPSALLVEGDVAAPPFRAAVFEVACSLNVMHHLEETSRHLDILAGLCRPGGSVFLCTFHPAGIVMQMADWWLRRTNPGWRGMVQAAAIERTIIAHPCLTIAARDSLRAGRFWQLRIYRLAVTGPAR